MLRATLGVLILLHFIGNSLVDFGLLPDAVNFLPEILVLAMALAGIWSAGTKDRARLVGLTFALLLVAATLLSTVANQSGFLNAVLFLRMPLRFYVMFLALLQLDVPERELRWYLRVLTILFLIQIPTAVVKVFIYGQGESAVGTYTVHGGGNSTSIPMIATAFLLTYYIVYRRSIWFLIGIVAFVAFGLVGGKRATFAMVPIAGMFSVLNAKRFDLMRRGLSIRLVVLSCLLFGAVFYVSVRCLPTLNPQHKVGGSFDLSHLCSYVIDYTTGTTEEGVTGGRFATTMRAFEITHADAATALFGLGPGTLLKTRFSDLTSGGAREDLKIIYGVTGFTWLLLQIGYPGTIVWLSFYGWLLLRLRAMAARERYPFWRAYYLGMVCFTFVVLFISLTYGSYMIMGDLMPFLYFLSLGIGFLHEGQAKRRVLVRVRSGGHAAKGPGLANQ